MTRSQLADICKFHEMRFETAGFRWYPTTNLPTEKEDVMTGRNQNSMKVGKIQSYQSTGLRNSVSVPITNFTILSEHISLNRNMSGWG
jgi:hypothetical protein